MHVRTYNVVSEVNSSDKESSYAISTTYTDK